MSCARSGWSRVDFSTGVLTIRTRIAEVNGRTWEKDTKTHQQRRIVLDPPTLELLRHWASRCPRTGSCSRPIRTALRACGRCRDGSLHADVRVTRLLDAPAPAPPLLGDGADRRRSRRADSRWAARTRWERDDALRVYSAWVAEADQRASGSLAARMPELPGAAPSDAMVTELPSPPPAAADDEDASPYRSIARDLRGAIRLGFLNAGDPLPTGKELMARYAVSAGTAHRAVALLTENGEAAASRGRRAVVV